MKVLPTVSFNLGTWFSQLIFNIFFADFDFDLGFDPKSIFSL